MDFKKIFITTGFLALYGVGMYKAGALSVRFDNDGETGDVIFLAEFSMMQLKSCMNNETDHQIRQSLIVVASTVNRLDRVKKLSIDDPLRTEKIVTCLNHIKKVFEEVYSNKNFESYYSHPLVVQIVNYFGLKM